MNFFKIFFNDLLIYMFLIFKIFFVLIIKRIEKYRPKRLEELISHENIIKTSILLIVY
jgi:hypothetical protein